MSLEWVDGIERKAADARTRGVTYCIYSPQDVERLIRALRATRSALREVLSHIVVDDLGLNCEVNDECCAGPAVLRAREVLERVEAGTI